MGQWIYNQQKKYKKEKSNNETNNEWTKFIEYHKNYFK
jgi:hypothetical protein